MKLKLKFLGFLQQGSLQKAPFESLQAQTISLLLIIRLVLGPTQPSLRNISKFLRAGVGGKGPDRIVTYIHLLSRLRQWPPYPYSRIPLCLQEEDRENFTFTFYMIRNISLVNSKTINRDIFDVET